MHRRRIEIEEKELDFVFELVSVQFNQTGQYQLILTAENPLLENSGSGVRLRVNNGEVLQANSSSTGTIDQANVDNMYTCSPNKFVFTLPKGFCKNDKNHDVRLKVEAILLSDSGAGEDTKAGEGFFAIYPRTNAPRINLFAGPDEELYQYSGIMALLRAHDDYLAMHCGRLVYTVAFHEAQPVMMGGTIGRLPPPASLYQPEDGRTKPDSGLPPSSSGPSVLPVPPLLLEQPEENETRGQEKSEGFSPSPPLSPKITVAPKPITAEPDESLDLNGKSLLPSPKNRISLKPDWTTELPPRSGEDGLLLLPLEDTPTRSPQLLPYTHVIESPRCEGNAASSLPLLHGHVSRPGEVVACVIVHGATSLPPLRDGAVPQPFASLITESEEARGRRSRGVTHGTLQPTHSPSWEETLAVELQDEQARGDVLVLSVADSGSRELLAYYRLPVAHLRPFQHYHLELVQDHPAVPSGVRLYVSVVLKTSMLPRQPCFSFTGFEVLLEAMTDSFKNPVGPLLAVARIVADYDLYRDTILLHTPSLAGVAVTLIAFPDPPESSLSVPPLTTHGRPQVSPAGYPQEQPVWRHSFLFLGRDCATVFSARAALVLEFYPTTTVMNSVSWHLRSPVGFCMLLLDQSLYRKLMSEKGHRGFRVPQLPLQGSHLQTSSGSTPSISIVLRLIGSERPDSILAETDTSLLPCLDPEQRDESTSSLVPPLHLHLHPPPDPPTLPHLPSDLQQEPDTPTSPHLQLSTDHLTPPLSDLQREAFGLPSYDALAQILPDYKHLFRTSRPENQDEVKTEEAQAKKKDPSQINHTYDIHSPNKRPPVPDFQDSSFHCAEVTEQQNKELENYRTAMCKMAEDIIALRTQLATSEGENSRLRSDLSLHQEVGRTLLEDTDVDVMTKAEITDRITSLKVKLASETSKAALQRDKIQQLQNELIQRNDAEKELERLRRAHQQQQAVLQRYQNHGAKMAGLETTVRQQEKVIEKMEKVLDTKLRERNKENSDRGKLSNEDETDRRKKEIECVLAAENARLREELERMRHQPPPVILQQPAQTLQALPDTEKFTLLSQLERAEARVRTLENQLKANSREWGREKQSLTTKLREQEHGFARTSTMILHDLPMQKSVTESVFGRIRHRQLDPLK